ncbi:hypothetical protein T10_856 [Trichinella papuae]|uniref:Uncharacterized protein n=1 Tax=Trichinella papuae TaxID=268474 RepID=A0A0V1LY84_9BILA|nr:hypothetical protein T10_856 [Trichinella papuae]
MRSDFGSESCFPVCWGIQHLLWWENWVLMMLMLPVLTIYDWSLSFL